MLAGLFLIAAGVGIVLTARANSEVVDDYNRRRAARLRERGAPRLMQRIADFYARAGTRGTVVFGRVFGAATIVGGIVLLIHG